MSQGAAPLPPYNKPWLSHADQVQLLIDRGLVVANVAEARRFISHINYYRFSGYCLAFENPRHQFIAGTTFEQVRSAYDFDMSLRDLVTESLEVVEVDLRATIAYVFGQRHGAFGHTDPANFFAKAAHADWLDRLREEADRSSELFVTHFRANYGEFPDLPIWVAAEVISFGALSKMIKWMLTADKKAVAARYGLQPAELENWTHHLSYVRNLCAHHLRLWDRLYTIRPVMLKGVQWQPPHIQSNDRLFATLLVLRRLLMRCFGTGTFPVDWRDRVNALMQNPPTAPAALNRMGMQAGWEANPIWN
jgi:abortive infection bacteriophage resistance protein